MAVIRVGTNDKYSSGWDAAFGQPTKKKTAVKKKVAAKKKATVKKKVTGKKKVVAKKAPAKAKKKKGKK